MAANAGFRRYVLRELRRRGPLRSRDLEDRAAVPWRSGGWNDGKNLGRMLEFLWMSGASRWRIARATSGSGTWPSGCTRPASPTLPPVEAARRLIDLQLRVRGVARAGHFGFTFGGSARRVRAARCATWSPAARSSPSTSTGWPRSWLAHRDALDAPFRPRTTLLGPFDRLVYNRERTEELFGFHYRIEIYVPKASAATATTCCRSSTATA